MRLLYTSPQLEGDAWFSARLQVLEGRRAGLRILHSLSGATAETCSYAFDRDGQFEGAGTGAFIARPTDDYPREVRTYLVASQGGEDIVRHGDDSRQPYAERDGWCTFAWNTFEDGGQVRWHDATLTGWTGSRGGEVRWSKFEVWGESPFAQMQGTTMGLGTSLLLPDDVEHAAELHAGATHTRWVPDPDGEGEVAAAVVRSETLVTTTSTVSIPVERTLALFAFGQPINVVANGVGNPYSVGNSVFRMDTPSGPRTPSFAQYGLFKEPGPYVLTIDGGTSDVEYGIAGAVGGWAGTLIPWVVTYADVSLPPA